MEPDAALRLPGWQKTARPCMCSPPNLTQGPRKPPQALSTRAMFEVILLENRRQCVERWGGGEAGLDGDTILNQHRVQVVVRQGEALIALADVVGDLVEVLAEGLDAPPRGLLHKMDVREVAKRPLQNKEPGAGREPSRPAGRSVLSAAPQSRSLSPTPLNRPCHPCRSSKPPHPVIRLSAEGPEHQEHDARRLHVRQGVHEGLQGGQPLGLHRRVPHG